MTFRDPYYLLLRETDCKNITKQNGNGMTDWVAKAAKHL